MEYSYTIKNKRFSQKRWQNGATLIEALIALFIFSIGALGLAALQLTSLMSSGESQQRSAVIWKAQEFADRIRANRGALTEYIATVNRTSLATIGVDSDVGVITCEGTAGFVKPSTICADDENGAGSSCADEDELADFDVWDVFCNPNGGLATVADTGATDVAAEGSSGVANLEIVLRQNDSSAGDTNDDVMLVLEWLSRETDANLDVATTTTISTDICDIPTLDVASSLNVYCIRFSL